MIVLLAIAIFGGLGIAIILWPLGWWGCALLRAGPGKLAHRSSGLGVRRNPIHAPEAVARQRDRSARCRQKVTR